MKTSLNLCFPINWRKRAKIKFWLSKCLPPKHCGEGIEIGLNHLLSSRSRILGELHHNKPVVIITSRKQDRLPRFATAAPPRWVLSISRHSSNPRNPVPPPNNHSTVRRELSCEIRKHWRSNGSPRNHRGWKWRPRNPADDGRGGALAYRRH